MKGSLLIISFFILGCIAGFFDYLPTSITDGKLSEYVLFLLMFLVGVSIGCDGKLKEVIHIIRPKTLFIPAATIIGSLSFAALASLVLSGCGLWDCLAIGSGFAYYSLSSILIMQIKTPEVGAQIAAQLGAIALLANIIRELLALVGAPLFVKLFGKYAPICSGGATTMDTTLPIITQYSGKEFAVIAILHGIIVDFTVPFFVSFFASL